jgi:ABC-type phosphate/phosphonate transport system substrate-binding protein
MHFLFFNRRVCAVMLGTLVALALGTGGTSGQPKPLRIGIARSYLTEQPKALVEVASDDFKAVMKKTTGLDGDLISTFDASEVVAKLDAKQLDFAILHAHELAWSRKKHPDLQVMLIAPDKPFVERAHIIVHKTNPAKSFADLRGKKLDVPTGTKEHCRLYLAKLLDGKDRKEYFGAIEKSSLPSDALDNVARQKVDAAIIDLHSLEFYKDVRGPVFEKNLRILQHSEDFPPTAIIYRKDAVDAAIVKQVRDGLLKAHTLKIGREMMDQWNIDTFREPPQEYEKSLAEILKAYPGP